MCASSCLLKGMGTLGLAVSAGVPLSNFGLTEEVSRAQSEGKKLRVQSQNLECIRKSGG